MQFIDLKAQYSELKTKIDARIQVVLDHGKYIMGPEVAEFEEKLAEYVGVKHAISCANGTDALQLCMMVLDIKANDAVFCPTFTFYATAEIVGYAGATPIFVDSDEESFNICPLDLENRIQAVIAEGKLTPKAIITVDLFGHPAQYDALQAIAKKYNLRLIEDAAQGFGGDINGKKAGSFGDLATTSFFPAKPLGCYGDGGAIFTDNDEYAYLLKSLRIHGKGVDKYDNVRIGINSRLDTIQAAILLEKLAIFPQELAARNKLAMAYEQALASKNSIKTPKVAKGYGSSWAQYTLLSDDRDEIMAKLKNANIPTVIYYATNMHQQTVFKNLSQDNGSFPIAEKLSNTVFSLPMHPYMDETDFNKIIDSMLGG
ncbi:MAG: DegT/DnrJ/EryC1/StrS family aminotransferase [Alphaproteobacteria bacterium]|nr:DegT/DnrJ/EryC1/StrS family aminotransferase [Alphaproteobacteria bacterium]